MEGQRCDDGQNGRCCRKDVGVEKRAAFLCHVVGVKSQTIARKRGWRFYPLCLHTFFILEQEMWKLLKKTEDKMLKSDDLSGDLG